ncbi:MAG: Ig-like domain-containing protein [Myxococcaceae bacterium]
MKPALPLSLFAVAVIAALGCDPVDYIDVQPSLVVLAGKQDSQWLSGKAMSHTRVHYPNEKIYWTVKDPSVAQVDDKGRVTPLKSGDTEVVATHREVRASVPVRVRFAEKVTVFPSELTLTEGEPGKELTVKVFDFQGKELKDRTTIFTSQDREVVSMGQNAVFPVHAGQTEVEVRVEDQVERVKVKVASEKSARR